jgi:hypothetical protein
VTTQLQLAINIIIIIIIIIIIAGLSPRRPGFIPRSGRDRFEVDKEISEQVFLRVLWFSFAIIISPMLRGHLHLHVVLTRRANGQSLGTFQKAVHFRKSRGSGGTR